MGVGRALHRQTRINNALKHTSLLGTGIEHPTTREITLWTTPGAPAANCPCSVPGPLTGGSRAPLHRAEYVCQLVAICMCLSSSFPQITSSRSSRAFSLRFLVIRLDERGVANFAGSKESSAEPYVAISNDNYTSKSSISTRVASRVPTVNQSASVKAKPHAWRAREPQYDQYDLCLALGHNATQTSTALSLLVHSLYLPGWPHWVAHMMSSWPARPSDHRD
jgi:hypothetical protein